MNRWPQTRLGSAILRLPATPTPTRRRHAGTRPAPYTLVCVAPPRSYVPPLSTSYYGNDLKLSPRSEEECRIRQGPRSDARLFQGSPTSSFDLGGKYLTRQSGKAPPASEAVRANGAGKPGDKLAQHLASCIICGALASCHVVPPYCPSAVTCPALLSHK